MRRKRILRRILRFWNHDSHFLPLQVTIDDLDPGIVVITVTAARLPMAQLYSLAVQGAFTGQLASAYNPGWDQTTSTVGAAVSSACEFGWGSRGTFVWQRTGHCVTALKVPKKDDPSCMKS